MPDVPANTFPYSQANQIKRVENFQLFRLVCFKTRIEDRDIE